MEPIIVSITNELRDTCYEAASKAGWWLTSPTNGVDVRGLPPAQLGWWVGAKLALVHSEVSEALEGFRKDRMDEHLPEFKSIEVELADAVIRICDLAGGLNLRLGEALAAKLAYNAERQDHKLEARAAEGGKAF